MPKNGKRQRGASKHTPGPWKLTNGTVLGADGVGVTRPIDRFDRAADANARLIAAAPDLYEACRAAFSILHPIQGPADDPGHKVVAKLIDALAKAGGGK